jgi:hypothetical protein
MKIIDALRNGMGHYNTDDMLYKQCELHNIDPNGEIEPGAKIKLGSISFMAFDANNPLQSSKQSVPEERECPTCGGSGKVLLK